MVEGSNWFFDQSPLETYHNVRRFCLMQSIILWSWCENKSFHRIHLFVAKRNWKCLSLAHMDLSTFYLFHSNWPLLLSFSLTLLLVAFTAIYAFQPLFMFWHFICLPKTESDNFALKRAQCFGLLQLISFHFCFWLCLTKRCIILICFILDDVVIYSFFSQFFFSIQAQV